MIAEAKSYTASKADIVHTIADLADKLGLSDTASSGITRLTFAIDDIAVTCALVERQHPMLWVGSHLGTLRRAEQQRLAWLLREAFPLAMVPGLSLGREPDTGDVFAYRLITADGLDADLLTDVIRDMIEQVRLVHDHIAHADFPNIFDEFAAPAAPQTMTSRV